MTRVSWVRPYGLGVAAVLLLCLLGAPVAYWRAEYSAGVSAQQHDALRAVTHFRRALSVGDGLWFLRAPVEQRLHAIERAHPELAGAVALARTDGVRAARVGSVSAREPDAMIATLVSIFFGVFVYASARTAWHWADQPIRRRWGLSVAAAGLCLSLCLYLA